jgi:hypothetical protein
MRLSLQGLRLGAGGGGSGFGSEDGQLRTGRFNLSGLDLAINTPLRVQLAYGQFTFTGQDATLIAEGSLPVDAGSFSLTGNAINLPRSLVASLGLGEHSLAGNALNLSSSLVAELAHGSFSLTGDAINLPRSLVAALAQGSYSLTGNDTTFTESGGGGAFDPDDLFLAGEKGFWLEPITGEVFTDVAGTSAASATDPIGKHLCTGRNHHRSHARNSRSAAGVCGTPARRSTVWTTLSK